MTTSFPFMGLRFTGLSRLGTLELLDAWIADRRPRMFFSLSAELIARAQEDSFTRAIYVRADLVTVDSYVVYYSARLCGRTVPEPVSASRVMCDLLPRAAERKYRIFLLGATEEVVTAVAATIRDRYPGIIIAGFRNGYFSPDDAPAIAAAVRAARPDILFVAMSSPLKEHFIAGHLSEMGVPVSIGVGGIFDIIAGKCRLAPSWVSRCGLEWLYRFVQEPRRMWRRYLITNIKYLLMLVRELITKG